MSYQKLLNIIFLVLISFWLFGTYKFSNKKDIGIPSIPLENQKKEIKNEIQQNNSTTTPPTKTKPITVKTQTVAPNNSTPTPTPKNTTNTEVAPDFESINTTSRKATVNIFCQTKNSDFSPISGTGIIISPDGLIITNAHVAQYFLLRDLYTKDFIECVIRTGSPAYPMYKAELVYISPSWVEKNKAEIKLQNPQGTGENDFAFLRITKSIDNSNLPIFSFLRPNTREEINLNEPVVLVSYPAGFLGGLSIIQNLYVTSAITKIQDIFTFKENTTDLIAIGGTVVSQKGASGGAVVDKNSTLIGIISTSSTGDTTSDRNLYAITIAYINRSLQNEINLSLSDFVSQDIGNFTKDFQENTAPSLTKLLTDEILKNQ